MSDVGQIKREIKEKGLSVGQIKRGKCLSVGQIKREQKGKGLSVGQIKR